MDFIQEEQKHKPGGNQVINRNHQICGIKSASDGVHGYVSDHNIYFNNTFSRRKDYSREKHQNESPIKRRNLETVVLLKFPKAWSDPQQACE